MVPNREIALDHRLAGIGLREALLYAKGILI